MRNACLTGGLVLGTTAFLAPGAPVVVFIAAAVALTLAAAWLGAHPAGVLVATLLALGALIALPDMMPALLKSAGANPVRFMRSYGLLVTLAALVLTVAAFLLAARRRGPTGHHAAIEAAEDIDRIVVAIGKGAAFLFLPLMLIIFYDIMQRKLIGYDTGFINSVLYFSSTKMQEFEWHLHAVLFLLSLGYAYVKDAHVRIELVRDRLKPRTRVRLEALGLGLFLIPYCYVITTFGITFADRAWA